MFCWQAAGCVARGLVEDRGWADGGERGAWGGVHDGGAEVANRDNRAHGKRKQVTELLVTDGVGVMLCSETQERS